MSEPLARYMRPNLTEARVERQWREIDARSSPAWPARLARSTWYRSAVLATVACAVAVCVVLLRGRGRLSPDGGMEGSVIESGTVTLADGSRVVVSEGGRVHVEALRADSVVLALDSGAVELAVPHTRRTLVVRTPAFDVVDVGTRFRVTLEADGAERVDVTEGSVEVRGRSRDAVVRRLAAGDSWSSALPSPPAAAALPPAAGPPPDPRAEPLAPAPSRDASLGPKELLEAAQRARLSGQPRAAGAALDTLRRRFRSDPRSALAAFELGRLRLDALADAPGAVEAFDDAIALAPRGPLREDAEARRVEALGVERSAQCSSARDAFLARYPGSAHAAAVAGRCARE